jgi:hypothetical protein
MEDCGPHIIWFKNLKQKKKIKNSIYFQIIKIREFVFTPSMSYNTSKYEKHFHNLISETIKFIKP